MILEVAILDVKAERAREFEAAFEQAEPIIMSMRGYGGHELRRCVERVNSGTGYELREPRSR